MSFRVLPWSCVGFLTLALALLRALAVVPHAFFFFSSRRRHTRLVSDWSSDVCSSDLTLPLMYQPGERWQYNVGSLVLGVLLARVAGQPLGDLLAARIFSPLGMRTTGFWLPLELTQTLPDRKSVV